MRLDRGKMDFMDFPCLSRPLSGEKLDSGDPIATIELVFFVYAST